MQKFNEIRPSPIAGYWYSGNPTSLKEEIFSYLDKVTIPSIDGEIIGLIAPHAGYRYSGQTAAYAFRCIMGNSYDLVVILSPFHPFHSATLLTSAHDYYQTPLGKIQVYQELVSLLMEKFQSEGSVKMIKIANDEEHSLEIEIPFLQCVLENDFKILPLMVRSLEPQVTDLIAENLAELIKEKRALIVCSTDLSHFYSQANAEQLDTEMLTQIKSFSVEKIYQTEATGKGFACGLGAVMVGVSLSKALGADRVEILHQSTSGDVTGDLSSVVGYGAAAFIRANQR